MANLTKFHQFKLDMGLKVHDFESDTFKWYLSNTVPNISTNALKADLAEISTGNGYTGPVALTVVSWALVSGTAVWTVTPPSDIVASGGTIGPFRYAVLYNDTPTLPLDPLIGYVVASTSPITLQDGEKYIFNISNDLTLAA